MADMAVSFAREKLLPLIKDEAYLLWNVPKEFKDVKKELEYIQAFLKDADRRATAEGDNTDEGIKTWVKQLREVAFRIEDVTDDYIIYLEQQSHDPGCAALLSEIVHFIETLLQRHQIASEIQDIKLSLSGIKQKSVEYRFQTQPSSEKGSSSSGGSQDGAQWLDHRMNSRYLDEAEVVGFEAPKDELIGWLLKEPKDRIIISVVGMGGQGKTTLASRVFNNQMVIKHFDYRAWITVSQSYNVEGLLRDMFKKFCKDKLENPPKGMSEMGRDSLIEEMRNYLQRKRYVVVLDDVWDVQLWGQIANALYDNKSGSRILITTRKMDVVNSSKCSPFDHVHELKPLPQEKSLELFWKKAFQFDSNVESCPHELMHISSEIVKKCKGLPLAIVAIGGLLSLRKINLLEWEQFSRNLSSELESDSHLIGITKILGFSYDDLPYYLKSCLLYFGIYPEDFEVRSKRLTRQWIAEGFVKSQKGKTLEEVAEQYLTELVNRSLVQVSSSTVDGKIRGCRVHDLLRDMILKKFKDLNFCQHISEDDEQVSSGIIQRLSVSTATNTNNLMGSIESSHVRSLLFFTDEEITEHFGKSIVTNYKRLKVLDFADSNHLSHSLGNLENLIHLKYLSFRKAEVEWEVLPESIGKLQNLETLNIRHTRIKIIPKEISNLKKLRHLLGDRLSLIQLKDILGGMTSLQTLREVEIGDDGVELIVELGKLKQLRNLSVLGIKEEHGSALCSSLNEMKQLEKIVVVSQTTNEVIDVSFISPPPKLQKLYLILRLNKVVPQWVLQLHNLVDLFLGWSYLTDDPLE